MILDTHFGRQIIVQEDDVSRFIRVDGHLTLYALDYGCIEVRGTCRLYKKESTYYVAGTRNGKALRSYSTNKLNKAREALRKFSSKVINEST